MALLLFITFHLKISHHPNSYIFFYDYFHKVKKKKCKQFIELKNNKNNITEQAAVHILCQFCLLFVVKSYIYFFQLLINCLNGLKYFENFHHEY